MKSKSTECLCFRQFLDSSLTILPSLDVFIPSVGSIHLPDDPTGSRQGTSPWRIPSTLVASEGQGASFTTKLQNSLFYSEAVDTGGRGEPSDR